MKKRESRKKKKSDETEGIGVEKCHCPYCIFMEKFSLGRKRNVAFWEHLDKAQIELLEAFRAVVDQKIDQLKERKHSSSEDITKIEIE